MARPARTRENLIALIDDLGYHEWTIDQLHMELQQRGFDVAYSSVFRALNQLQRDGFVTTLATESDKITYEKSDLHHEHLKCELCGELVSFECVLGEELSKAILSATGFKINRHLFTATGICLSCRMGEKD